MSFIENKIYFMFMNMNTKDQKVQQSQKKILRETWNSKIEEHCVKPQTQDQLKEYGQTKFSIDPMSSPYLQKCIYSAPSKQANTIIQISKPCLPNKSKHGTFQEHNDIHHNLKWFQSKYGDLSRTPSEWWTHIFPNAKYNL